MLPPNSPTPIRGDDAPYAPRGGLVRRFVPLVLYMCLITYGSAQPGGKLPPLPFPQFDKIEHTTEYAILGGLLARAIANPFVVVASGIAFGVLDEFHQTFVPQRSGNDPGDITADSIGSLLGMLVYRRWRKWRWQKA